MLSLFRRQKRQKGLKQRRGKRKRRLAQIVMPAVVTTALLIPLITGTMDGSGDAGSDSTAVASSDGSDGGSTYGGSSDGSTSGGSSGGAGATSGDSSDSTGDASDSAGTTAGTTSTTAEAGSVAAAAGSSGDGSGTTPGLLDGLTLDFTEDPNSGTELDPAMDPTLLGEGETITGTGSAFDDFPSGEVIVIEEDWELLVSEPDPGVAAPQVGTIMTPFEDSKTFYLAFVVNHRFNPSYAAGGMELQLWYQGEQLGWFTFGESVLGTADEKIEWTQRLELVGGKLRFSVVQGKSTTWGKFGSGASLHLELSTTLTDLNDYHPNVSAENSGILYASNRVSSLVLKRVRALDKYGEMLLEDADPVVVFGSD